MKFSKNHLNNQLKALHGILRPEALTLTAFKNELAVRVGEKSYSHLCRKLQSSNLKFRLYDHISILSEILHSEAERVLEIISESDVNQSVFVRQLKILKTKFQPDSDFKTLKDEFVRRIGYQSFSAFARGVAVGRSESVQLAQSPLQILAYARLLEGLLDAKASDIQDVIDQSIYTQDDFCCFLILREGDREPVVYREDRFDVFNEKYIVELEGMPIPPKFTVFMLVAYKNFSDEDLKRIFEFKVLEPINPLRMFNFMGDEGGNLFSPSSLPVCGTFDCSGVESVFQARHPAQIAIRRFEKIFTDSKGYFTDTVMPLHAYIYSSSRISFACYYPREIEVFKA